MDIIEFDATCQDSVRDFVLDIQNGEFNIGLTLADQPDLSDIASFYLGGNFWMAKENGQILGTIGIQNLDGRNGILRKMFVKKEFRGIEPKIAQLLFDTLIQFSLSINLKTIWLDTPAIAVASHRFYERNGFLQADKQHLPENYVFPDKNSKIYRLAL